MQGNVRESWEDAEYFSSVFTLQRQRGAAKHDSVDVFFTLQHQSTRWLMEEKKGKFT